MRVLVCGDRHWQDYDMILSVLEQIKPEVVVEGEAKGADIHGRNAAISLDIPFEPYPADWDGKGRAAGPIRNQQMLDEGQPELVLAFHDNLALSRGTLDMVRRALKRDIRVTLFSHSKGSPRDIPSMQVLAKVLSS